jgi:hypothetical protein
MLLPFGGFTSIIHMTAAFEPPLEWEKPLNCICNGIGAVLRGVWDNFPRASLSTHLPVVDLAAAVPAAVHAICFTLEEAIHVYKRVAAAAGILLVVVAIHNSFLAIAVPDLPRNH